MKHIVINNKTGTTVAGPFETAVEAQGWMKNNPTMAADVSVKQVQGESHSLLNELLEEGKVKLSKKLVRSVYHRDYLKTKKKPYRKYDPDEYAGKE